MTGLPERNKPEFDKVAAELREAGYIVISPVEIDPGEPDNGYDDKYYIALKLAIKSMLECDTVVVLDNWESSNGARLEAILAGQLRMPIIEVKDILWTIRHSAGC